MGLFYHPPQPPAASNSGTPPEPHAPIGNQGNPPPRYTTALMMVAVLAAWPLDLEPRLTRPNDRQQTIAPLTLTYGDAPARIGTSRQTYQTAVASWPLDLEPRLSATNARQQTIAPLTLRYGDPPPTVGASAINKSLVVGAWPPDLEPRLGVPNTVRVVVAPLTLLYGDQPPPQPALAETDLLTILAAWPTGWDAQTAPKNAGWNVPPLLVQVPYARLPRGLWTAWEPIWLAPPPLGTMATLTLPTGDAPPPIAVPPRAIWRLWEPPWQSPPPLASVVAALYVPPIVLPGGRGPALIMIEGRLALRISDFLYAWVA